MTFTKTLTKIELATKSQESVFLLDKQVLTLSKWIKLATETKKFTTIFGNGGSAADAEHWAGEMVCTFESKNRKPYLAAALSTNSSIITAWSNDFTFDQIFERQIQSYCNLLGVAIGLSTSGTSINVLRGLKKAKSLNAKTVLITGSRNTQLEYVDLIVNFNSKDTSVIQTLTQVFYHSVCEELENY